MFSNQETSPDSPNNRPPPLQMINPSVELSNTKLPTGQLSSNPIVSIL